MHSVAANGARIPALGLGTWTLKDEACIDLVSAAIGMGYTHLDTAAMYANEKAVGEGVRASGADRRSLFVTTKVWYTDIASGDLERSTEASLKRLDMDYVDLLLIHWPNPSIALSETIAALNRARDEGLARHIGVSNFTTTLLNEATALSNAPIVCNQVEYHPYLDQTKVLSACRKAGVAMTSYCPLGRGGALFEEPAVTAAARAHGKTSGQIVLRWHVQQDGVVCIPRTSSKARLAENIDVFDFELSGDEMAAMSALKAKGKRICDFDFSPEWDAA